VGVWTCWTWVTGTAAAVLPSFRRPATAPKTFQRLVVSWQMEMRCTHAFVTCIQFVAVIICFTWHVCGVSLQHVLRTVAGNEAVEQCAPFLWLNGFCKPTVTVCAISQVVFVIGCRRFVWVVVSGNLSSFCCNAVVEK